MNFAHVRIVTAFAKKMDVGHQGVYASSTRLPAHDWLDKRLNSAPVHSMPRRATDVAC